MARLPRRDRVRPSHGARRPRTAIAGRPTCPASRRPGWTRSARWCATRWCSTARAARPMRPASSPRSVRGSTTSPPGTATGPAAGSPPRWTPGSRPDDVERWLAVDAPTAEVRRRALAGVAALPAVPGAADVPGDWIGAVAATGPRAAFTARVAALVDGTPGRALLLNLVGGPDDVLPLLDPASPVAVLVESTDPRLARCTALRPVVEAKKAVPPPARGGRGRRQWWGSRCCRWWR